MIDVCAGEVIVTLHTRVITATFEHRTQETPGSSLSSWTGRGEGVWYVGYEVVWVCRYAILTDFVSLWGYVGILRPAYLYPHTVTYAYPEVASRHIWYVGGMV